MERLTLRRGRIRNFTGGGPGGLSQPSKGVVGQTTEPCATTRRSLNDYGAVCAAQLNTGFEESRNRYRYREDFFGGNHPDTFISDSTPLFDQLLFE